MTPLGYLDAAGQRAQAVLPLTWLTLVDLDRRRASSSAFCCGSACVGRRATAARPRRAPYRSTRGGNGVRWISIGMAISAVPLLVTLVWTMVALAAVSGPPAQPGSDAGHHRRTSGGGKSATTRPSPTRPSQRPTRCTFPSASTCSCGCTAADVIHSFWVPKLTGKTDAIPGQTNLSWMRGPRSRAATAASAPNIAACSTRTWRSRSSPNRRHEFERWRAQQLAPAPAPTTPEQMRGDVLGRVSMRRSVIRCAARQAGALAAPDLTHLMSRANDRRRDAAQQPRQRWRLDRERRRQLKPGNLMPDQNLAAPAADRRAGLPGDAEMRAGRLPHADHRGATASSTGAAAASCGKARRA